MKNIYARLLLAAIGIPLLAVSIFLLPHFNHIGMALITIAGSTLGAYELARLFRTKEIYVSVTLSVLAGFILPTVFWFTDNPDLKFLSLPSYAPTLTLTLIILITLATEIINTTQEQFEKSLNVMSAHLMIILYPSYLSTYILKIGALDFSIYALLSFFVLVFTNDSFAYFSGVLLGKKSWKPFPISPHKSIVGFIGGFLFTILAGCILFWCKPEVFNQKIYLAIILAVLVSIFANIGDLVESAAKRSAGVKDSGKLMLGRGGVLDCIDSLLFAAPLYYLFFEHFIQN